MMKFTVPAKPFMAAILFKASFDPRFYLKGVLLSSCDIVSTNGHILFSCKVDKMHDYKDMIIDIVGKIPSKTYTLDFEISEENQGGIAWCKDAFGFTISVIYVKIIDGKFPDWKKPFESQEIKETKSVGLQTKYLSILDKAVSLVGNPKFKAVEINLCGSKGAVICNISGPEYKSTVLIMPVCL